VRVAHKETFKRIAAQLVKVCSAFCSKIRESRQIRQVQVRLASIPNFGILPAYNLNLVAMLSGLGREDGHVKVFSQCLPSSVLCRSYRSPVRSV